MTTLELHPDRLFPVDPGLRALARSLYATVATLPIVSPHGHTDPQWYADDAPFPDASALFITPDHYVFRMLYSQGVRLEDLGIPPRADAGAAVAPGSGRDRRAEDLAPLRRALAAVPRHADARVARPRVPRVLRHPRAARACESADRIFDRINAALAHAGIPAAGAVRALRHRGDRDHRVAARPARAPREDPRLRLGRPRDHRVPPRPGRRPRVRGLPRPTSRASARSTGENTATWSGYLAAHRNRRGVLRLDGRDFDRPRPSDRADGAT